MIPFREFLRVCRKQFFCASDPLFIQLSSDENVSMLLDIFQDGARDELTLRFKLHDPLSPYPTADYQITPGEIRAVVKFLLLRLKQLAPAPVGNEPYRYYPKPKEAEANDGKRNSSRSVQGGH